MLNKKVFQNNKITIIIVLIVLLLIISFIIYWYNQKSKKENQRLATENNNITATTTETELSNQATQELAINSQTISEAQTQKSAGVEPIDKDDYTKGDIDSKVKIIVYCSFTSQYCAQFQDTLKKVKENFPDQTVIAVRSYILPGDLTGVETAMASECAGEQGKFWEMSDSIYNGENNLNLITAESLKNSADTLGLNTGQFNKCFDSNKYLDKIQKQIDEAKEINILGVPYIFVNNNFYTGNIPFDDYIDSNNKNQPGLKSIIEEQLNK